jgi:hypothetical protein
MSTVEASIGYGEPSTGVTSTRWVCPTDSVPRVAVPCTTLTPALTSLVWMSVDWARASRFTRACTAVASTLTAASPPAWIPNSSVSR